MAVRHVTERYKHKTANVCVYNTFCCSFLLSCYVTLGCKKCQEHFYRYSIVYEMINSDFTISTINTQNVLHKC